MKTLIALAFALALAACSAEDLAQASGGQQPRDCAPEANCPQD